MRTFTYNSCKPFTRSLKNSFFSFWTKLIFTCIILFFTLNVEAQSIISASISDNNSNRLMVTFSEAITVTDGGAGFRLVGGVARIESLFSGSGTNTLIFTLTDNVLPDDEFELLHWPELSDARGSSGKLIEQTVTVSNNATGYNGSGTLYYVSTSGNNSNNGLSPSTALQSISNAQNLAQPGDYILLKRGDTFNAFMISTSGNQNLGPIVYAAYGPTNTAKPIVTGRVDLQLLYPAPILINQQDYVVIDNLHILSNRNGISVVQTGDEITISNCLLEGIENEPTQGGINFANVESAQNTYVNPQILNNTVRKFRSSIQFSGFPYNENYEVLGGVIENNTSSENRETNTSDGIVANRGDFNGLVIRKNDIADYYDDGIDLFAASNVIVEYNRVHDTGDNNVSGVGIKAGGRTTSDIITGYRGGNVVIRYNTVYDIQNANGGRLTGITSNKGASGEIYGNLVYNTGLHGIELDDPLNEWNVYNNTIVDAGGNGISVYVSSSTMGSTSNVSIINNIADGNNNDIGTSLTGVTNVQGSNNIWINNQTGGGYTGQNDLTASISSLFVNATADDYRLAANAPAIDAGSSNFTNYTKDIRGFLVDSTPDIGAYEHGDQVPPIDPPSSTDIWLEAECADNVGSDWEEITDTTASHDIYLKVNSGSSSFSSPPTDPETRLTFNFSTSQAGQYKIFTRHLSYDGNDDSFWVQVNGGTWVQAYLGANRGNFVWAQLGSNATYALSSGSNTITIALREPNAKLDKLYITLNGNQPTGEGETASNCLPPAPVTDVWLEAECADNVGSDWTELNNQSASQDSYLKVNSGIWSASSAPGATGQISFSFSVSEAGAYKIFTRHLSLDGSDDSFWLRINSGSWVQMAVDSDVNAFVWEQAGNTFSLNNGTNTITIGYREPNFGLDKLFITLDGNLPTGEGSNANNCGNNARVAQVSKAQPLLEEIEIENSTSLQVFPNPVSNRLTVNFESEAVQDIAITLTNLSGKTVKKITQPAKKGKHQLIINTEDIPSGMYLLQLQTGSLQTFKVLIEH